MRGITFGGPDVIDEVGPTMIPAAADVEDAWEAIDDVAEWLGFEDDTRDPGAPYLPALGAQQYLDTLPAEGAAIFLRATY